MIKDLWIYDTDDKGKQVNLPFAPHCPRHRTGVLGFESPGQDLPVFVVQQTCRHFAKRLKRARPVQNLLDGARGDARGCICLDVKPGQSTAETGRRALLTTPEKVVP